ncbi:MAG TPA: type II toxin-antitoxin system VapC family toxin [Terriglobales bacterium]|nr:type II toxin-antitoxin system VapC family toxin [Terriglobales bacterium]
MVYLDTSALVPLFVREPESTHIRTKLDELPPQEAAVSDWVLLEFASAIAARVRGGSLRTPDGTEAIGACEEMAQTSFQLRAITADDIAEARGYVEDFRSGLRAADAVHLAVAHRLSARLLTMDRVQARAARRLGISVL